MQLLTFFNFSLIQETRFEMREIIDASVGAETFRDIIYFNFIYNGTKELMSDVLYIFATRCRVYLRYFKRCQVLFQKIFPKGIFPSGNYPQRSAPACSIRAVRPTSPSQPQRSSQGRFQGGGRQDLRPPLRFRGKKCSQFDKSYVFFNCK